MPVIASPPKYYSLPSVHLSSGADEGGGTMGFAWDHQLEPGLRTWRCSSVETNHPSFIHLMIHEVLLCRSSHSVHRGRQVQRLDSTAVRPDCSLRLQSQSIKKKTMYTSEEILKPSTYTQGGQWGFRYYRLQFSFTTFSTICWFIDQSSTNFNTKTREKDM